MRKWITYWFLITRWWVLSVLLIIFGCWLILHGARVEAQTYPLADTWIQLDGGTPSMPDPMANLYAGIPLMNRATPGAPLIQIPRLTIGRSTITGYWSNGGINVPCPGNGIGTVPYLTWTDPATGTLEYLRGDMAALQPNWPYGTYFDAIFGNHTHAYAGQSGEMIPVGCENCAPNFYPCPADDQNLSTQWAAFGNTTTCQGRTDQQYSVAFKSNSVWTSAYAFYLPTIQAACSGPTPSPAPTRTVTPVPSPTPIATPSSGNPAFTVYEEALRRAGVTSGCQSNPPLFCGTRVMTREEVAVWLAKALKLPLLPCQGMWQDAPCPTATPVVPR
jgi:hypothetical protein